MTTFEGFWHATNLDVLVPGPGRLRHAPSSAAPSPPAPAPTPAMSPRGHVSCCAFPLEKARQDSLSTASSDLTSNKFQIIVVERSDVRMGLQPRNCKFENFSVPLGCFPLPPDGFSMMTPPSDGGLCFNLRADAQCFYPVWLLRKPLGMMKTINI